MENILNITEDNVTKKESIWTHNFTTLFFANLATYFASQMVNSLLPKYARSFGASDTLVGIVSSAFAITALATRPFSGPAIDSWNRKKMYLAVITMNAICMFGYGLSTNIGMIIAFRLLHGISNGTSAALCLSMATESLPHDKISSGIGTYMLSQVIPSAIGPALGQWLSRTIGYKFTYCIAGVLILLATFQGAKLDYSSHVSKKLEVNLRTVFAKEAIVPALIICILHFGTTTITSFITLVVDERGISGISAYYTILALSMLISRPVAGKIADRYGTATVVYPCLTIFGLNLLLMAYCNTTWQLWLCAVLYGFGYSAAYTMIQALALKMTPPERRGAASSTCYAFTDIGMMLGPTVAGIIADHFGYRIMFLYAFVPLVIAVAIYMIWNRRNRKNSAEAAETA